MKTQATFWKHDDSEVILDFSYRTTEELWEQIDAALIERGETLADFRRMQLKTVAERPVI